MDNDIRNEFGFEVVDWCAYCHGEIYVGEDYIVDKGATYHRECYEQANCYADPNFLDDEEE